MAVQVNIPGAWTDQLVASGITAGGANGYQTLTLALGNTGNTMLKPHGTLVVQQGGRTLQNLTITMNTFLPETSIQYPVLTQQQALGPGSYDATLDLSYGNGQRLHYTSGFTITDQQVQQVFKGVSPPRPQSSSPPWWVWLIVSVCLLATAGSSAYAIMVQRRAGGKPSRPAR